MANNSTRSAKTKVIHAGFLLTDPDIQPKSEQSILIEGERIKAVSDGFIDPPTGGELVDLRKKFVLPGLIDCHVHLTAQLEQNASVNNLRLRGPSRIVCHGLFRPKLTIFCVTAPTDQESPPQCLTIPDP